jgi:hypothetical protein
MEVIVRVLRDSMDFWTTLKIMAELPLMVGLVTGLA